MKIVIVILSIIIILIIYNYTNNNIVFSQRGWALSLIGLLCLETISAVLCPVLDSLTPWKKGRGHLIDGLGKCFIEVMKVLKSIMLLSSLEKCYLLLGFMFKLPLFLINLNNFIGRLTEHKK